jgi:hypothetical protein
MVYCTSCGAKLPAGARYCTVCGKAVNAPKPGPSRMESYARQVRDMRAEGRDMMAMSKARYEEAKRIYERARKLKRAFDKRVGA